MEKRLIELNKYKGNELSKEGIQKAKSENGYIVMLDTQLF